VRCAQPVDGKCGSIADRFAAHLATLGDKKQAEVHAAARQGLTKNTTITAVITNRALPFWALQRLAVEVHTSMARGIQPYSMSDDGDVLFAVTTAQAKAPDISDEELSNLGVLASETAWDAILASVPNLPAVTPRTNITPSPAALDSLTGRYTFAPDAIAELRHKDSTLEVELIGRNNDYLTAGHPVRLSPVARDEFELAGPRGDRLRIDRGANGTILGITLNPGPWAVRAVRR
jgi:hypothetical protein